MLCWTTRGNIDAVKRFLNVCPSSQTMEKMLTVSHSTCGCVPSYIYIYIYISPHLLDVLEHRVRLSSCAAKIVAKQRRHRLRTSGKKMLLQNVPVFFS